MSDYDAGNLGVNKPRETIINADGTCEVLLGVFNKPSPSAGIFTQLHSEFVASDSYPIKLGHPTRDPRITEQAAYELLLTVSEDDVIARVGDMHGQEMPDGSLAVRGRLCQTASQKAKKDLVAEYLQKDRPLIFGVQCLCSAERNEKGESAHYITHIIAFNVIG